MNQKRLLVRLTPGPGDADPTFDATLGLEELRRLSRNPWLLLKEIGRRQLVTGRLADLRAMPKPLMIGTILRLISSGPVALEDRGGRRMLLGWPDIARSVGDFLSDSRAFNRLLLRISTDLDVLERMPPRPKRCRTGQWFISSQTSGLARRSAAPSLTVGA